jgi:hypothetical protein
MLDDSDSGFDWLQSRTSLKFSLLLCDVIQHIHAQLNIGSSLALLT